MKTKKSLILQFRNVVDNQLIKKFYDEITSEYHEPQIIANIMKKEHSTLIIKTILSKSQRSDIEITILNMFLKTLTNFMSMIREKENEEEIDAILNKICRNLTMEIFTKNTFLMRVGEIGKHFYITLSGKVSILIPKTLTKKMTLEQYKTHLKFLFNNNEINLLERTFNLNKSIYNFDINEIKIKDNDLIIGIPLKISIGEYISKINGEDIKEEEFYSKDIEYIGYYKVVDLSQGSSFGEIALINENNERTATIFVNEDSFFGVLSAKNYQSTLRQIQERIKRENVEFIFSMQIFNQIGINNFVNKFWNYFIVEKRNKGEFIFKCDEERKKIYFIQNGEIKLVNPNLTQKQINLIIENLTKTKIKEIIDEEKGQKITLTQSKKGDILGLNDILYNGKFICNAECVSNTVSFFSIDINILNEMRKKYKKVNEEIQNFENKKINLILNRLKVIKKYHQTSLVNTTKKKLSKEKLKIQSFFDTKGEEIIMKQSDIPRRKSQVFLESKFFLNNILPNKKKYVRRMSLPNTQTITSNLFLQYNFDSGIIDKNKKKKKIIDSSSSSLLSSNDDSDSKKDIIKNKEISKKSDIKLPLININKSMQNNKISFIKKNSINEKRNSLKNIVMNIPQKKITHLIKFNPIKREMISLNATEEENKIEEEKIKKTISFTEPNDYETKEYVKKVFKKSDNVSKILDSKYFKNSSRNNYQFNNMQINKIRLWDKEFESLVSKSNVTQENFLNEGFKAKNNIPPNFMKRGKKIRKLILKKK